MGPAQILSRRARASAHGLLETRSLERMLLLAVAAAFVVTSVGCRGWTSDQPPVHINPNMDTQPKYKAYRGSDFFADGRTMRLPPEGTVARTLSGNDERDADFVASDAHYYDAVVDGQVVNTPPPGLVVNEQLLERGRDRYNIYCSPCHAQHGTGNGLVASRLTIKPPTFHDDVRYTQPLGHFYRVITHGAPLPELRATPDAVNMPSYAVQVPPRDRWAIALYLRALQRVTKGGPLPPAVPMSVDPAAAKAPPTDAPGQPSEITEASPTGGGVVPADKQPVAETPSLGEGQLPENPTPSPPSREEGAEVQQ